MSSPIFCAKRMTFDKQRKFFVANLVFLYFSSPFAHFVEANGALLSAFKPIDRRIAKR